ncbi:MULTISPECIES: HupE/UreJ family protein [Persicobacter]|uniref:HupE / UreJ protein n=1 Tax=Persicobacter diffluens TaxID=981 RepID=A0AAN5AM74_9BACT|nr:HupE/UreJ family protein [Persicobacter sp. CCB-QB2]GJM62126.1 hypothetical protein PEDI_26780 [Persicobacter diffluens]
MSTFSTFFEMGWLHILDLDGYDHLLFVVALCLSFTIRQWQKILGLLTAFTVGHSISLALATFRIVKVNGDYVEFLIPLTIFITGVTHLFQLKSGTTKKSGYGWAYAVILAFGLIHGLGFSSYLQSLLGRSQDIFTPLLAFNLGLEAGQVVIVIAYFLLFQLFTLINKKFYHYWKPTWTIAILTVSVILMYQAKFW